jgi:hypothetical protein
MSSKIDRLHAVKLEVVTTYKTTERQQPLRAIPARLSALAVFETLDKLGFVLPIHAAAETEKSLRYGQAPAVSAHAVKNEALSEALASINLPISERIRFRFACDRLGLLK